MKCFYDIVNQDNPVLKQTFYLNLNRTDSFNLLKHDLINFSNLNDSEIMKILSRMSEKKVMLIKHKNVQIIKIKKG